MQSCRFPLLVIVAASIGLPGPVPAGDLDRTASWTIPSAAAVHERMLGWLGDRADADAGSLATARALWNWPADAAGPADLLDAAMETFALLDPRCAALRGDTTAPTAWLLAPSSGDEAVPDFQRDAVRLWVGRQLVRQERFDEALPLLEHLDVATSIDPVALLFHRAACRSWLLDTEAAIEDLDRLLERSGGIPVRYERMAALLRADIAALEDGSLDHIARRMRDITRRLDLGNAGPKTRSVQDGVIASLDALIKKLEDQQNQCQSPSGGAGSGAKGGGQATPMEDSRIAGGKGPGEVRNRDIGRSDGWGNLPPHRREEALQQIGREFPAHYREAIEQYFKRLAGGGEGK